jgi:hypothetical protein
MIHVIDQPCAKTPAASNGSRAALSQLDVAASLSAVFAGVWDVEHAVDPSGDESIVVLPVCDDPALPTFVLYEGHGVPRLATIRRDVWESDQAFPSGQRAVAAIMTAATSAAAPPNVRFYAARASRGAKATGVRTRG